MSFAERVPTSPNEGYLRQIAEGTASPFDRDPQSPTEALLRKIATGEGEVPDREPQSANEYWLKQIAEGGGGGSSYKLIWEKELEVSTTTTVAANVDQVSGLDRRKSYFVIVRDKAGEREGYFYGTDSAYIPCPAGQENRYGLRRTYWCEGGKIQCEYVQGNFTGQHGVYPAGITTAGSLIIYARYNSNYSKTIDGTYIVKVYEMEYPDGYYCPTTDV